MEWGVHREAAEEFLDLPEEAGEMVRENIEARRKRENPITEQRNVGLAFDDRGKGIYYFKAENGESCRVFFDFSDGKVVLLGVRERTDMTYMNLRELTERKY
jgi:hypothetical protein